MHVLFPNLTVSPAQAFESILFLDDVLRPHNDIIHPTLTHILY